MFTLLPRSRAHLDHEIAETIGAAVLTGIDDRRRPLVLDERGARHRMLGRQRAAVVARHREGPGAAEVRAQLARRPRCARGLAGGQRERVGDQLRADPEIDALDALAGRVAVELLVASLEGRAQRIWRADVIHLEL